MVPIQKYWPGGRTYTHLTVHKRPTHTPHHWVHSVLSHRLTPRTCVYCSHTHARTCTTLYTHLSLGHTLSHTWVHTQEDSQTACSGRNLAEDAGQAHFTGAAAIFWPHLALTPLFSFLPSVFRSSPMPHPISSLEAVDLNWFLIDGLSAGGILLGNTGYTWAEWGGELSATDHPFCVRHCCALQPIYFLSPMCLRECLAHEKPNNYFIE